MALDPRKIESVRRRQKEMFSKALDRRTYNLTIKEIADRSGVDDSSLANYAAGITTMSLAAIDALVDVIPDELLSMLLPSPRVITMLPDGIDHDELDSACREYLKAKAAAHHPDSPSARDISDCENVYLLEKAAKVKAAVAA